jgi:phosphoenolpyruvate carboxykinase (GTP)
MTTNPTVLNKVEEIQALVKPENVVWIDGTAEQITELTQQAVDSGVMKPLNSDKLPGCMLHRTSINDAARTEQRTFVCTENAAEAGPANNWLKPREAKTKLNELFNGIMTGRTMYVIPILLGNPQSPLCKAGVEITDSVFVVLNTVVLTKCGKEAITLLDSLVGRDTLGTPQEDLNTPQDEPSIPQWFFGVHSMGVNNPRFPNPNPETKEDNRYICHFPQENSVWAINTGYGANAFLSKKSMALQLASITAKQEGWLAEHMMILELEDPSGELTYIAAAFPSGCGKTTLAMMDVPQIYAEKGYKIRCVSDDVAWLRKGQDGRLWAINPETGIFGCAPGVNAKTSPNVFAAAQKNTIFTNVVHNLDDDTVWWEGMTADNEQPSIENALDWRGNEFKFEEIIIDVAGNIEGSDNSDSFDTPQADEYPEDSENGEAAEAPEQSASAVRPLTIVKKGAHPNSRFTAPITNCPNLSPKYGNPEGVPISAIIFGGRRSKAVPLVYQSFDWEHGVFVGTVLGTEPIIAPGTGSNSSSIRRDPMAMLSYCGYNMADYWQHWLKMGKKLGRNAPKIFNVNWFKAGEDGVPIWPGFGENIRVLEWVLKRLKQKCSIVETPLGYSPKAEDIDLEGLDLDAEKLKTLFSVDKLQWKEDVNSIKQFYAKFGNRLPEKLKEQLIDFEKRLVNS